MRFWKILVPVAVVAALLGWAYGERKAVLVTVLGTVQKWRSAIAETQPVDWEAGPQTADASPSQRPPNVIVILADDLGFNDISFYGGGAGGGTVKTPHIDAIARQGVSFTNGYAGNAVCAPSRAMILTGRYSTRFGFEYTPAPDMMVKIMRVLFDGEDYLHPPLMTDQPAGTDALPFDERGMPPSETTMAEVFKKAGYHTLHIGKWHLGRTADYRARAQGFDESLMMESGLYLPVDDPGVVNAPQDDIPIDKAQWAILDHAVSFNDGGWFRPDGYLTDYFTDQAVAAITANRNRPFFLYLAHWGVHTPLQAAREDYEALSHIEDHTHRVYAAMIRALDRGVGKVLATLEEQGLADNTLVIFTSDNGGADYINLADINRPYRGWKLTLFEGGTHVPFFMRWPAGLPQGARYDHPVSHLDILPTAAAAAGLDGWADKAIDGADLLAYVSGAKQGAPHDHIIWREGYYQAIRQGAWKMQVSDNPAKVWLYNLALDPTEQTNLADQTPAKVEELQALLEAHNAEQAPPAWPSLVELPIYIDQPQGADHKPGDDYIYWPN